MFLIGLTGGAATGKSTASGYFKELGVPVIDADEVAKLIVEPGQPAFNEIKATFGQEVIASTGQIVSDSHPDCEFHLLFLHYELKKDFVDFVQNGKEKH